MCDNTPEVEEVKELPLDSIARSAYNTRKTELWTKIVEEFQDNHGSGDMIIYMGVAGLNIRLRNLRQYTEEYNEIIRRLNTRELKINY